MAYICGAMTPAEMTTPKIRCFLSSRMPEAMTPFRDAALDAVRDVGSVLELWRFEDRTPAAVAPEDFYLPAVAESDVLVVILGDDMSQATIAEVRHAIALRKDVLALRLAGSVSDDVTRLIEALRAFGITTAEIPRDPTVLTARLFRALLTYIVQRFRRAPSLQARNAHLVEARNGAVSRIKRGLRAAQLSDRAISELASNPFLGLTDTVLDVNKSHNVLLLVGPIGSGKSTTLNRMFIRAVERAQSDILAPAPIWLSAREAGLGLSLAITRKLEEHGGGSFTGAAVFIDDLDAEDEYSVATLLNDATAFVDSHPNSSIVMSKRTKHSAEDVSIYELPELNDDDVAELVKVVATDPQAVTRYLDEYPQSIRRSIRRPLFLLLTIVLTEAGFETRRFSPASEAELLESMVQHALRKVLPSDAVAEEALQRFAELLMDSGEESMALREIPSWINRSALIQSSLTVAEGGQLTFALPVIGEWFSARRLRTLTFDAVIEKVRDIVQSDRWHYALRLFVQMSPRREAFEFTCLLAKVNPALACIIATEGWGDTIATVDYLSLGRDMRHAMSALQAALPRLGPHSALPAPAAVLVTPAVRTPGPGRIRYGWFECASDCAHEGVVTTLAVRPRCVHKTTESQAFGDALFPFRLSAAAVFDGLKDKIEERSLFINEPALEAERLWLDFLAVSGRGVSSHNDRPIALDDIRDRIAGLPNGVVVFAEHVPNWSVDLDALRFYIASMQSDGQTHLNYPSISADTRPASGGYSIWDAFSDERALERARYVYSSALRCYAIVIDAWLPPLRDLLTRRLLLPARVVMRLSRVDNAAVVATDAMIPLPESSPSSIFDIEWGSVDESALHDQVAAGIRAHRNQAIRRVRAHVSHGVLDMFGIVPVHDVLYDWLKTDLDDLISFTA